MKEKEEFKFEEQFEAVAKSCINNGYVIPSFCFKNYDEKIKYAAYMYFNDKLIMKYGTSVLFKFSIYASLKSDKSFDEWYETEYLEKHSYLDNIQETLESFNTFDKTTGK